MPSSACCAHTRLLYSSPTRRSSDLFLLRGAGFSLTDVGWANKWLGVGATILGLLIGGALMARLRLFKSLLLFGFLQAFTNLGFMLLAAAGKSYPLMITVIAAENLCGGMGTAEIGR